MLSTQMMNIYQWKVIKLSTTYSVEPLNKPSSRRIYFVIFCHFIKNKNIHKNNELKNLKSLATLVSKFGQSYILPILTIMYYLILLIFIFIIQSFHCLNSTRKSNTFINRMCYGFNNPFAIDPISELD